MWLLLVVLNAACMYFLGWNYIVLMGIGILLLLCFFVLRLMFISSKAGPSPEKRRKKK